MTDTKYAGGLLPCPFCGACAESRIQGTHSGDAYAWAGCTECHADINIAVHWMEDGKKDLADAIAAWNRRAPTPEAAALADMTRQRDEARDEGFAAGLEAAAGLVAGGFDRVVAEPRRNDGALSKSDKCPHDRVMYEDCEQCAVSAIRALAEGAKP